MLTGAFATTGQGHHSIQEKQFGRICMEKENVEAEGNVFVLQCQLAFNMGRLDGQLQSLRQHTIGTAFLLQRPSHGVFSTFDWQKSVNTAVTKVLKYIKDISSAKSRNFTDIFRGQLRAPHHTNVGKISLPQLVEQYIVDPFRLFTLKLGTLSYFKALLPESKL